MRDLAKYERQLSLNSLTCSSGRFAPYVDPNEAQAVRRPCIGNGRREIVTCSDDDREQDLEDVGGLDMMDIHIGGSTVLLPRYIPMVPKDIFGQSADTLQADVVGVRLGDILTKGVEIKNGHLYLPESSNVDPAILRQPIFKGKRVILFSTGQDVLIERLWHERRERNLLSTLAGMGFLAITGMNFSVFDGECAFAHALNIVKSLRYSEGLDQLGAWAIPHIYAINIHQRRRWVEWILANPNVKMVTINSQMQRRKFDRDILAATVRNLLDNTSVEVILQGYSRFLENSLFGGQSKRVHSATISPIKSALVSHGKLPGVRVNDLAEDIILSDLDA